jgi:cytoskeletal protein CcmA (bactofilin family)
MSKHYILKLFIVTVLVVSALFSTGATVMTHSETTVVQSELQDEDYFFGGQALKFNGAAANLYFAGQRLDLNGSTENSIFTVGTTIDIKGDVGNNAHIAGQVISISGTISGNTMILGEDVTIEEGAVIDGTLFIMASHLQVDGVINEDLYTGAGFVSVTGTVKGNVKASVGRLNLHETARIEGNVDYHADRQLTEAEQARVNGEVTWSENRAHDWSKHKEESKAARGAMKFVFGLFIFLSFLIGGLLILLLPITKKLEDESSAREFWFSSLWGLIPLFIYPVVVALLFAVFITAPLGLYVMLAAIPLFFLTKVIGVTMSGRYLFSLFKWNKKNRFLYFLFGSIIYLVCMIIPVINILVWLFLSSIGWGAVISGLFKKKLA